MLHATPCTTALCVTALRHISRTDMRGIRHLCVCVCDKAAYCTEQ